MEGPAYDGDSVEGFMEDVIWEVIGMDDDK